MTDDDTAIMKKMIENQNKMNKFSETMEFMKDF